MLNVLGAGSDGCRHAREAHISSLDSRSNDDSTIASLTSEGRMVAEVVATNFSRFSGARLSARRHSFAVMSIAAAPPAEASA